MVDLLVIIFGLYFGVLIAVLFAWWGMWQNDEPFNDLKVSVIVPFRDEAKNLPVLVHALQGQVYDHFEVVFVNDHSSDDSEAVLSDVLAEVSFAHQSMSLPDGITGKKSALSQGIYAATGELILTTDADCVFEPGWIADMVIPFQEDRVKLVSGPVRLSATGVFQRWQQMEFATLIGIGGVTLHRGTPTMVNGANLAYRKSVFQELNGFQGIDHIPTGDDELFMKKVHGLYKDGLAFRKTRQATVTTPAQKTWDHFRNQRLRWASKWSTGKRWDTMLTAIFVALVNLSLILTIPAALFDWADQETLQLIWLSRLTAELLLVLTLSFFFRNPFSLPAFVIHQLLYPFYVVYFGLMANFGKYQWKGRSYPVRVQ